MFPDVGEGGSGRLFFNPFTEGLEDILLRAIGWEGTVLNKVALFLAIGRGLGGGALGTFEVGTVESWEATDLGEPVAGIKDEKSLEVRCSSSGGLLSNDDVLERLDVSEKGIVFTSEVVV